MKRNHLRYICAIGLCTVAPGGCDGSGSEAPGSETHVAARPQNSLVIPGVETASDDVITARYFADAATRYELKSKEGRTRFFIEGLDGRAVEIDGRNQLALDEFDHPKISNAASPFIQNVNVTAGTSTSVPCPAGYSKLNQDLNQGASGKFIYLCLTRETTLRAPLGINDLTVLNTGSSPVSQYPISFSAVPVSQQSNGDLNQGAGGNYIYFMSKNGADRLIGLGFVASTAPNPSCSSGWARVSVTRTGIDADLNRGAGGHYIYLCTQS